MQLKRAKLTVFLLPCRLRGRDLGSRTSRQFRRVGCMVSPRLGSSNKGLWFTSAEIDFVSCCLICSYGDSCHVLAVLVPPLGCCAESSVLCYRLCVLLLFLGVILAAVADAVVVVFWVAVIELKLLFGEIRVFTICIYIYVCIYHTPFVVT